MKRIMSLMLGMSLVLGAATVAFAQDSGTTDSTTKKGKKKGGKKKGGKKKTDDNKK